MIQNSASKKIVHSLVYADSYQVGSVNQGNQLNLPLFRVSSTYKHDPEKIQ